MNVLCSCNVKRRLEDHNGYCPKYVRVNYIDCKPHTAPPRGPTPGKHLLRHMHKTSVVRVVRSVVWIPEPDIRYGDHSKRLLRYGQPLPIYSVTVEEYQRIQHWDPGELVDLRAPPYNLEVIT